MTALEKTILDKFKSLVQARVVLNRMVLFGSRARGDADLDSDMDVLVVYEGEPCRETEKFISHCAWEVGFDAGIIVMPVTFTRDEWENSPQRSSLLAIAVRHEGIPV